MSVTIKGTHYLRTHEVLKRAGISRATFFRWLRKGVISDSFRKDRRGWRLFTESDVIRIKQEAERTYIGSRSQSKGLGRQSEAK